MSNCLFIFAYLKYIHLTLFYFLRNDQNKKKRKNISVTLANAAKDKTFQDKGNEAVVAKLREFGVGAFAASKKTGGAKSDAKGGGGGGRKGRGESSRYCYYSSSEYDDDSDDDEFERELRRRRKWSRRKGRRSRSRSRSRGRSSHYYDDVSISTITGEPRDCSPPVRREEKSDSLGTYVSDRE